MNDNRNYNYSLNSVSKRDEYNIIIDWIREGTNVLDLGCGDGSLLKLLEEKGITGEGIDLSASAVRTARRKGLKAQKSRIDGLLPYEDKHFDYSICNVTLQMVMYPEITIKEMQRVSNRQIISFPNFAFILNRFDLLINGRMPKVMIPGYEWYSTGHIHQLSIADFEDFCMEHRMKILDRNHLYPVFVLPRFLLKQFPNIFALTAIYLL